jgi:hypothetical protein
MRRVLETERLLLRPIQLADASGAAPCRRPGGRCRNVDHPASVSRRRRRGVDRLARRARHSSIRDRAQGATEAAHAVVRYAFDDLDLHRVYAHHFVGNPASGRVLQKIGMTYDGRRRQHTVKWGARLDSESYAILRDDQ